MADLSEKTIEKDIGELAVAGFRWNLYSTVSLMVMQLSFGIILARLLPPDIFGVFFYAMIFIGFASIFAQAGIPEAIIQRQQLTKQHIETGFTLTLLIGLSVTISLWILAEVMMKGTETSVLRTVSFSFLLSAFGAVSGALLEKGLHFRKLFWAELVSYGVGQGVISIGLAMMGFGVWSLAYGVLTYALIKSAARMLMTRHSLRLSLKSSIVKDLVHFGFGRSLARLANYGAQHGDYFVIGQLLPSEALGLYSRAYQIARIPTSHIASTITSVLFPVYSAVQDDKQRLKKGFYLSVSLVSFVTFPLMVWFFMVAGKLIPTIYGPAWIKSIRSLEILTVCGALGSIYTLCDALVSAKGLVYAQFRRHLIYAAMVVVGSLFGIGYGIEGVALAVSLSVFIMYTLMAKLSINIVDGTWADFLRAQFPGVATGISVALVSSMVLLVEENYGLSNLIVLLTLIFSFAAVYPIVLVLFPMSCLGEIPECLVVRCSSFLPRGFLGILNRRLNLKARVKTPENIFKIALNNSLSDNLVSTKWHRWVSYTIFVRLARRVYSEILVLNHILRHSLAIPFCQRLWSFLSTTVTQSPLSWRAKIGPIKKAEDFKNVLTQNHVVFIEGGHTFYIPPQPNLTRLWDEMVMFYPSDAGFKVLKQFQPPRKVHYIGNLSYGINGHPYLMRILSGSIKNQVESANVLNLLGIGPALYDVAEVITAGATLTCFVVQHIDNVEPTASERIEFIERLRYPINDEKLALVHPEGLEYADFTLPDRRNLVKSTRTGKLQFVDFDAFIVRNKLKKEIGSEAKRVLCRSREKCPYQPVSGLSSIDKRTIDKRWTIVKDLLYDSGIQVANRIVLDVGCDAGMMLSSTLADGASWGMGWDLPDVVEQAQRLNAVLGNTRLNFYGAYLSEKYLLSNDIPERFQSLLAESVVFYLAVWKRIGVISELGNLPWKALVFEGHEGDTWENLGEKLLKIQSEWRCTLAVKSEMRDGNCGTRPVAVLLRKKGVRVPQLITVSHSLTSLDGGVGN